MAQTDLAHRPVLFLSHYVFKLWSNYLKLGDGTQSLNFQHSLKKKKKGGRSGGTGPAFAPDHRSHTTAAGTFPGCHSPHHTLVSPRHTEAKYHYHLASHILAVFFIVEKYFSIKSGKTKTKPRDLHVTRRKKIIHKSNMCKLQRKHVYVYFPPQVFLCFLFSVWPGEQFVIPILTTALYLPLSVFVWLFFISTLS